MRLFAISCALAVVAAAPVSAKRAVQPVMTEIAFTGRVTDAAGLLVRVQKGALEQDLAGIEARTRRQIVVATIPTLDGRNINHVARDLGDRWGIGDARRDDGVVILLAPREQMVRIAVGEGLDQVLTDAVCQRIINEVMLPEFREGRLFEGLSRGVAAINAEL